MHYDYDPLAIQGLRKKPQGILLAIEDNTFLDFDKNQVTLHAGDMVVFDGDVLHSGSQYDYSNTRVHAYLDVPTYQRPKNRTYFP